MSMVNLFPSKVASTYSLIKSLGRDWAFLYTGNPIFFIQLKLIVVVYINHSENSHIKKKGDEDMTDKEFDEYSNYDDRPKAGKMESKTIDYSVGSIRSKYEEIAKEENPLTNNTNKSSLKEKVKKLVDKDS